jgi:phage gp36-like protein
MYCTLDDLRAQVPEAVLVDLTDDEGTGAINADRVNAAIASASSEIDGYCQSRYPVPFDPVPPFIKKLAVDITLYNLFARRGYDEDSADRSILDRYKNAVRVLENIAKGVVTLGQPTPPPATGINIASSERKFSRKSLEAF